MLERFLDFLFPQFCELCGMSDYNICPDCRWAKFDYYHKQECHVCREAIEGEFVHNYCLPSSYLGGLVVSVIYSPKVKSVLEEYKYKLYHCFATDIAEFLKDSLLISGIKYDCITAVPLYREKEWKRGFNHAELLAKLINRDKYKGLLIRKKNTQAQARLGRKDRLTNVVGAFEICAGSKELPEVVLIVDDVFSTGATMEECAKVLKENGVKEVYGCVWARGLQNPYNHSTVVLP